MEQLTSWNNSANQPSSQFSFGRSSAGNLPGLGKGAYRNKTSPPSRERHPAGIRARVVVPNGVTFFKAKTANQRSDVAAAAGGLRAATAESVWRAGWATAILSRMSLWAACTRALISRVIWSWPAAIWVAS
jgi:hypothetical protein